MKKVKIITLVLSFVLILTIAFPSNTVHAYVGVQIDHDWSYRIEHSGTSNRNYELIYEGAPAAANGEYDTISYEVSYSHSITGSIEASLSKKISASLGYSSGKSVSFTIAKNSAQLNKGEYVKAYYAKTYEETTIYQTDHQHVYGWELADGGSYNKVDYYPTEHKTGYGHKAIMPKIKLEYYKSGRKIQKSVARKDSLYINENTKSDEIIKTEVYEYVDGEYTIIPSESSMEE